jgi:hypothetical protein
MARLASRQETPFAFIPQMAQTAIITGNRNTHNLSLKRIAALNKTVSSLNVKLEGNGNPEAEIGVMVVRVEAVAIRDAAFGLVVIVPVAAV